MVFEKEEVSCLEKCPYFNGVRKEGLYCMHNTHTIHVDDVWKGLNDNNKMGQMLCRCHVDIACNFIRQFSPMFVFHDSVLCKFHGEIAEPMNKQ